MERALDAGAHIVNGQKVWTSYAGLVTGANSSFAPTRALLNTKTHGPSRGYEIAPASRFGPLRQMTGESEFKRAVLRDVRVPVENVLGKVE